MEQSEITLKALQDQINDLKAEIVEISGSLGSQSDGESNSTNLIERLVSEDLSPTGVAVGVGALVIGYMLGSARAHRVFRYYHDS